MIDRNAGALAQIVEDVLDVSRIVLGKASLKMELTDLAAVVQDAIETVNPAIDAKGIKLKFTAGHGTATVAGDHGRLQQVVWNLLSNAVKFTPQRRHHPRAGQAGRDSHVAIVVSDSGIGFSPSFQPLRVRAVSPGRERDHANSRRAGAWAGDRASHCRNARRHDQRGKRGRREGGDLQREVADEPGAGEGLTFGTRRASISFSMRASCLTSCSRFSAAPRDSHNSQ